MSDTPSDPGKVELSEAAEAPSAQALAQSAEPPHEELLGFYDRLRERVLQAVERHGGGLTGNPPGGAALPPRLLPPLRPPLPRPPRAPPGPGARPPPLWGVLL